MGATPPLPLKLDWDESFDEFDNSLWEAAGPYGDEDGASLAYWRLRLRLRDNALEWYEDHDGELVDPEKDARTWDSLETAQHDIFDDHLAILKTEPVSETQRSEAGS